MSYIPNTPEDQRAMLEKLGLPSLEALMEPVPENVRLRRPLNLPPALAEPDLKRLLNGMAVKNKNLDSTLSFWVLVRTIMPFRVLFRIYRGVQSL